MTQSDDVKWWHKMITKSDDENGDIKWWNKVMPNILQTVMTQCDDKKMMTKTNDT